MSSRRKLAVLLFATLVLLVLALPFIARFQGQRSLAKAKAAFAADIWPLDLESHRPSAIETKLNAAHWARAGGEALVLTAEARAFLSATNTRSGRDWTPEERARAAALVAQNPPALDLLHLMAELRESSFELDYAAGRAMEVPNLLALLDVSELLLTELRLEIAASRLQNALRALRCLRSLARACQRESPLIFQIVGIALEQRVWRGTEDVVFAGFDDPALLAEVESPLLETTAAEQLRRAIGFEAATLVATSAEELVRDGAVESALMRLGAPYFKAAADAQTLDYYRRVLALYPRRSYAALIADPHDGPGATPGFPASGLRMTSGLELAVERFKALEAMRVLASVALAARRAALASGSYPPDLRAYELAAANPYDGSPLTWRLETEGGAMLEAPAANDLWSRRNPNRPERHRPVFSWRLPPLAAPAR